MEGRRQKAREGRWIGGFAPYGYQLVNGELIIAEDEAEIIRIIYDKFVNTTTVSYTHLMCIRDSSIGAPRTDSTAPPI